MRTKLYELIGSLGDGGAETLVKDYALHIDNTRFDLSVVVMFYSDGTANAKRLEENHIRVLPVFQNPTITERLLIRLFGKRYMAYRLWKLIKKDRPEVIHMHLQVLQIVSYLSKKMKNIKLLYTCHSLPERMIGKPGTPEFEAAKLLIDSNNLQLIALHDEMAKEINEMFRIKNTKVIYNGVEIKRFAAVDETKEDIRKDLGIPQDAFVIGHVGRFSPVKNHSFLIEIFEKVIQTNKKAFLLLVGAGELRDAIITDVSQRGLAQRVLILSNRKDSERLYKAMDVFAFPSQLEGFPLAVLEAQASEIRCFVSDRVPKETCATELVSYLDIASSDTWVNAIQYGAEVNLPQRTLKQYDMPEVIKQLEELYLREVEK